MPSHTKKEKAKKQKSTGAPLLGSGTASNAAKTIANRGKVIDSAVRGKTKRTPKSNTIAQGTQTARNPSTIKKKTAAQGLAQRKILQERARQRAAALKAAKKNKKG